MNLRKRPLRILAAALLLSEVENFTKKITDEELLDIISKSTLKLRGPMWLENLRYNENHYGFKDTVNSTDGVKKSLVFAAGPGFKKVIHESMEKIVKRRDEFTIIACDGALPILSQFNCVPDYVVTVDGDQIITKFYKNTREILDGVTVILSTTVHPDVVEECINNGAKIKWIQPFFKNSENKEYFRDGITSLKMGGNVGTASYLFAALPLKSKMIGIMGIEFAWSDETPYNDTQYYKPLLQVLDNDKEKVTKHYVHIKNPRDGRTYIADPVYYAYFLMFKEIWGELPVEIQKRTYNLTHQGIINIDNLRYISIDTYLELT